MASVSEAVLFCDWHICVYYDHSNQLLTRGEGLNVETRHFLTDSRIHEVSGRHRLSSKTEVNVCYQIQGGEKVGNDSKLCDTLFQHTALELAPLLFGKMAVDGLVHVTFTSQSSW